MNRDILQALFTLGVTSSLVVNNLRHFTNFAVHPLFLLCKLGRAQFNFRKEVIHPQLRLGIPCYDLSLIADLYLSRQNRNSIITDFTALTGGVYKTRERIHRSMLICDYYRFRLHEVKLQTSI